MLGLKRFVVSSYTGQKTDMEWNFFTKYFYSTEMLHEILEVFGIFTNLIGDWLEEFFKILIL